MNIVKLDIQAFGKFENTTLDFNKGLNLIYGLNEAGKSTLHAFLEAIFYGFYNPLIKVKKTLDIKEAYRPQSSNRYGGAVVFTMDDETYRLERNLNKADRTSVKLTHEKTGKDITATLDTDPITKLPDIAGFIRMPYILYKNTLSIEQLAIAPDPEAGNALMKSFQSIGKTKSETLSATSATEWLKTRLSKNIGTPRTKDKPLNQVMAAIDALKQEEKAVKQNHENRLTRKQDLEDKRQEKHTLDQKITALEAAITRMENTRKQATYQTALKLKEKQDALLKQKAQLEKTVLNQINDPSDLTIFTTIKKDRDALLAALNNYDETHHQTLKQNADDLNKSIGKQRKKITFLENKPVWKHLFKRLIYTFKRLFSKRLTTYKVRYDKTLKTLRTIQEEINQQSAYKKTFESIEQTYKLKEKDSQSLITLSDEAVALASDLTSINTQLTMALGEASLEKLKASIDTTLESLDPKDLEASKTMHRTLEQTRNTLILRIQQTEDSINFEENNERPLAVIEAERTAAEETYQTFIKETNTINQAIELIEEGVQKIEAHFTPKLNQATENYLHTLTDQRYQTIKISKDMQHLTYDENARKYQTPAFFSQGTSDQIYFAIRLGMLDALEQGDKPLLLDDAFVTYDDQRLAHALAILNTLQIDRQIILFTCQNREQNTLKTLKISYHMHTLK